MFDALRRGFRFRQKVRAAGLRLCGTGTLPADSILWVCSIRPHVKPFTVFQSPHLKLLNWYQRDREDLWGYFRQSSYYEWHLNMRGYDHPRPDEWIEQMGRRLCRLYDEIRTHGYRCACVADRIAVFENGLLWDGGHRMACLVACGCANIPVVYVQKITMEH